MKSLVWPATIYVSRSRYYTNAIRMRSFRRLRPESMAIDVRETYCRCLYAGNKPYRRNSAVKQERHINGSALVARMVSLSLIYAPRFVASHPKPNEIITYTPRICPKLLDYPLTFPAVTYDLLFFDNPERRFVWRVHRKERCLRWLTQRRRLEGVFPLIPRQTVR